MGDASHNEREVYIVQKRPHNSGRIDSILLGYINNSDYNVDREHRIHQTSNVAMSLEDIHMYPNFSGSEFIFSWKCNIDRKIFITRVRVVNNFLYLLQKRREGQSNSSDYLNNQILLGSAEEFRQLFTFIAMEILGQSGREIIENRDEVESDTYSNESPTLATERILYDYGRGHSVR